MRKTNIFSAVFSLFLLVPASITWAQNISSQKGLTTALFTTAQGNIKVYLPDDIKPGDVISGRIIVEPLGKNEKQVERNLSELKKYSININSEKFPVDNTGKPIQFVVHSDRPNTGQLELINASGVKTAQLSIPAAPKSNRKPASDECMVPTHALTGSPLRITGPFDGNSSNTSCNLGNKPMVILAESPGQCILFYPADGGGVQKLEIKESGKQPCLSPVSGVNMNVSAGKLNLQKGENTYIDVSITGLQNLPDTALLTLTNITSGIVIMQPSNIIAIPLSPDSVGSGVFNRRFEIQSIRTGGFTVIVNLDLPEVQAIWPPRETEPQPHPGDTTQPQPVDTTHPPTVAQCPGCTCSCGSAKIVAVGTLGDETTYRVEVKGASCSGTFSANKLPPCNGCAIIDPFTYDWLLSGSADKPVDFAGSHDGPGVTINNKSKGGYTLYVTVTITCPDGHHCSCVAEITVPPPTIPVGKCPGCQCECDVKIKPLDKQADLWAYIAVVDAVCTGEFNPEPPCEKCKWISTTYLWTITKGDGTVVKLASGRNGAVVVVRTIKKGKFSLHVLVTTMCSDKHECKCEAVFDDEVLDDGCILTWKEMAEPKMTGGLDPLLLNWPKSKTIRRDDFIALKAIGEDMDYIKFFCTSIDCQDITSSIKYQKLPGRVRFEWEIDGTAKTGSFVGIGCLPENEKKDIGENVIFKPPYLPLPTGKDADGKEILESKISTDIILSVIDVDPDQPTTDKTIKRDITITTRRTKANPDFYEISIRQADKMLVEKFTTEDAKGVCEVILGTTSWSNVTSIDVPVIKLPAPPNNDKLISGEWIRLEAKDQTDSDHLKVYCNTTHNCNKPRIFNKDYADPLEWVWTANTGKFVGSNKGRYVIYEAPLGITQETDITITVTVDDIKGSKFDDAAMSGTIKIKAYPGGIKLEYPPVTWLPDPDKPATLKSWLVYKDKVNGWQQAFEHVRRIHFFELMNVSNEKGVCLNAPIRKEAKSCRDLLLKDEKGLELIDLNNSMKEQTIKNKCDPAKYLLEARTAEPENNYEVEIYSEDYGSFGFVRSFANLNKHDEKTQKKEIPYYEPVAWTDATVQHLHNPVRAKKRVYNGVTKAYEDYIDNRVTIPYDIDENHIPDNGWPAIDGKKIVPVNDPVWNYEDKDALPLGDGVPGDGFTNYEEYRGFMTLDGKEVHIRSKPGIKTLFIHREDPKLDIDLFKDISGLETYLISETQYDHEMTVVNGAEVPRRWVNFNFTTSENVIEQWGLKLVNGKAFDREGNKQWGISQNINKLDRPSPPNWEYLSTVDIKSIENGIKELNDRIVVWNKNNPKLPQKIELKPEDKIRQVVAHELLHGCNVCHHGEKIKDESIDTPQFGGLRSGNIDCVMRYDNLGAVEEFPPDYFPEKIGTILCNNPVGTGYNTPVNGMPQGRGNASNGNCIHQIHVSARGGQAHACGIVPAK